MWLVNIWELRFLNIDINKTEDVEDAAKHGIEKIEGEIRWKYSFKMLSFK